MVGVMEDWHQVASTQGEPRRGEVIVRDVDRRPRLARRWSRDVATARSRLLRLQEMAATFGQNDPRTFG
jgi:hypothetical protein